MGARLQSPIVSRPFSLLTRHSACQFGHSDSQRGGLSSPLTGLKNESFKQKLHGYSGGGSCHTTSIHEMDLIVDDSLTTHQHHGSILGWRVTAVCSSRDASRG
jgi:hypothetical protein